MIKRSRGLEKLMSGFCLFLVLLAAGCAAPRPAAPTATPMVTSVSPPVVVPPAAGGEGQRLRVTNQSAVPIQRLVVRFPDQGIDFGSLAAGATSAYHPVPGGVYRYAAYDVEINGKTYQQPVIDWVGETPMEGRDFTYVLQVDPGKWESEGWVIQLVEVGRDG